MTELLLLLALNTPTLSIAGDFFVTGPHKTQRVSDAPLVVNFEGALCPRPGARNIGRGWKLCADLDHSIEALRALNVRAVILANNHTHDAGAVARLELVSKLRDAGFAIVDGAQHFCRQSGSRPVCVFGIFTTGMSKSELAGAHHEMALRAAEGARVVVVQHLIGTSISESIEPMAAITLGVGRHEAGEIRVDGSAILYAQDLGDVVVDCRCSQGQTGLVVDIFDGEEPRVRVFRAAHSGDEIGVSHPAPGSVLTRLLAPGSVAYVVDGELRAIPGGPP